VFNDGGTLVVQDLEADKVYELTLESCLTGWQIMKDAYPQHWLAAQAPDQKPETGDVFLQCCLFGEVVYG